MSTKYLSLLSASAATFGVVLCEIAASSDVAAPEWIKIAPLGANKTRDNRNYYFDGDVLVAAFKAGGIDIPIDLGHATESSLIEAAPAIGWIDQLEVRDGGIYGRCQWLEQGLSIIKARTHRYVSPAFIHTKAGAATMLKSVGLVTTPALAMPAVASVMPILHTGDKPMKLLLAKLGLTENATEDEALAKLASVSAIDTAQFVPVSQLTASNQQVATLKARLDAIDAEAETSKCQALVDKGVADGKITPAAKDHYIAMARSNFDACSSAITAMPVLLSAGADGAAKAAEKTAGEGDSLSPEEVTMASTLGLSAEAYKAAKAA